jgi:hypothetical protein
VPWIERKRVWLLIPLSTPAVKIVTGSLNGVLRVYCPMQSDFRIEHLLLEENLRRPILQLALGYFIPYAPFQLSGVKSS